MPKRGNHRWSQGFAAAPAAPAPSDFERVVARLKLTPAEYSTSPQLRTWVEKDCRQKFVSLVYDSKIEKLLKFYGI